MLLIEDDQSQRFIAAFALRKAGYTVHQAGDGEEGLALIRKLRPDAVVCDVMMPLLNGYQVVTAVREDPAISATPVILLTALAERSQVRAGMTSGADDYLPKPYRPDELVQAIESVLDRRNAHHEALLKSLHKDFKAALDFQKSSLADHYESQLVRELNSRWDVPGGSPQLEFKGATLLLADLFSVLAGAEREQVARAFQAARDSLYLFGAAQVLAYGADVLAVFGTERDEFALPAAARAVRSAFALQNAIASALGRDRGATRLSVALHRGDVTLLKVDDPLHGDAGCSAVPGTALQQACALREFASSRGWAVIASDELLPAVPGDIAKAGRRESVPAREVGAIELIQG